MPVLFLLFVTGDLEAFKKQCFVLKEGVEYKIKISFKVRAVLDAGNMLIGYLPLASTAIMEKVLS